MIKDQKAKIMKKSMMLAFTIISLLLVVSMVWNGCRKDDNPTPITGDFDEYVRALPYAFGAFDTDPQAISEGSESTEGYYCDYKEYSYSAGYGEVILLDPTTDVIAPGMFIKPGASLTDGNYTPITNAKKPLTLTRSTGETVTIENPSLSSIRQGIQEMNQNAGTGSANVYSKKQSVNSEQELRLRMGAHYKNPWVKLSTGFGWSDNVEKNFMYANFVQVYYTVEVDANQKNNPSDWFETPLPDYENWNESPVYVSSVKYGRIGILTMESKATKTEMEAFVKAALRAFGSSGSIDIRTEYKEFLDSTKFKVLVIGGNPEDAVASVINGYEGFLSWIEESASFSEENPGSPVAYSLRYLKDNTPAAVVLSGSYTVKECYTLPEELTITMEVDPDLELGDYELGPFYPNWDPDTDDRDFASHGPMQNAYAKIDVVEGKLRLELSYEVKQWKGWTGTGTGYYPNNAGDPYYPDMVGTPETAAKGIWYFDLIDEGMIEEWPTPANEWRIKEVLSPKKTEVIDLYYNHAIKRQKFSLGPDSFVNTFWFVGDTSGDDVVPDADDHCSGLTQCTNMTLELNPIKVIFERK